MGNRLDVVPIDVIFKLAAYRAGKPPQLAGLGVTLFQAAGTAPATAEAPNQLAEDVVKYGVGEPWMEYLRDRMLPPAQRAVGTRITPSLRESLRVIGPTWNQVFARNPDVDLSIWGTIRLGTSTDKKLKLELAQYVLSILASPTADEATDLAALYQISGNPSLATYAGKSRYDWAPVLYVTGAPDFSLARYGDIRKFAWGLDLRDFVDAGSGVRSWIGVDGTMRSFFHLLRVLTSAINTYPWPTPAKYFKASWINLNKGNLIRWTNLGISQDDLADLITVTILNDWDKIADWVQATADDAQKRRERAAKVTAVVMNVAKIALLATGAGAGAALALQAADTAVKYQAAKDMAKLAEYLATEDPAFAAQVEKTAAKIDAAAAAGGPPPLGVAAVAPLGEYKVYVESKLVATADSLDRAIRALDSAGAKVGDRLEIVFDGKSTGLKVKTAAGIVGIPADQESAVRAMTPAQVLEMIAKAEAAAAQKGLTPSAVATAQAIDDKSTSDVPTGIKVGAAAAAIALAVFLGSR